MGTAMKILIQILTFSLMGARAFADGTPGKATFVDLDDGTAKRFAVLKIEGDILPPLADEVKAALQIVPSGKRVVLDLQSPGGVSTEGYKLIEAIKDAKKTLKIDTFVDNGATCASLCVAIFMQGHQRTAGERSTFMFHGASLQYAASPDSQSTKEFLDQLITDGVSKKWIHKLRDSGVFIDPTEYWANGEELYNEKSNIVTALKSKWVRH